MKLITSRVITLLAIICNVNGIYYPKYNIILKEYLEKVPTRIDGIYSAAAVTISRHENAETTANFFLQVIESPVVIISSHKNINMHIKYEIRIIFHFVRTKNDIEPLLNSTKDQSYLHYFARVQFIICEPVKSYEWVQDLLKMIWSYKIINYVVTFTVDDLTKTFSYNKFADEVTNLTDKGMDKSVLFPDKIRNVFGHKIKVALNNDYPRIINKNGTCLGRNCLLLKSFCEKINATYEYFTPHKKS